MVKYEIKTINQAQKQICSCLIVLYDMSNEVKNGNLSINVKSIIERIESINNFMKSLLDEN